MYLYVFEIQYIHISELDSYVRIISEKFGY